MTRMAKSIYVKPAVAIRLTDEQWAQLEGQLAHRLELENQAEQKVNLENPLLRHKVFGVWFALWAEQADVALDRLPRTLEDLKLLLRCRGSSWNEAVATCRRVVFLLLKNGTSPKELDLPYNFR